MADLFAIFYFWRKNSKHNIGLWITYKFVCMYVIFLNAEIRKSIAVYKGLQSYVHPGFEPRPSVLKSEAMTTTLYT
jgi:hypothetical protein